MEYKDRDKRRAVNNAFWKAASACAKKNKLSWSKIARQLGIYVSTLSTRRNTNRDVDFGLMCSLLEILGFEILLIEPDKSQESLDLILALRGLMRKIGDKPTLLALTSQEDKKLYTTLSGLSDEQRKVMFELAHLLPRDTKNASDRERRQPKSDN